MTQLAVRNAAAGLMTIKENGSLIAVGGMEPLRFKQISRFIFTEDALTRFKKAR